MKKNKFKRAGSTEDTKPSARTVLQATAEIPRNTTSLSEHDDAKDVQASTDQPMLPQALGLPAPSPLAPPPPPKLRTSRSDPAAAPFESPPFESPSSPKPSPRARPPPASMLTPLELSHSLDAPINDTTQAFADAWAGGADQSIESPRNQPTNLDAMFSDATNFINEVQDGILLDAAPGPGEPLTGPTSVIAERTEPEPNQTNGSEHDAPVIDEDLEEKLLLRMQDETRNVDHRMEEVLGPFGQGHGRAIRHGLSVTVPPEVQPAMPPPPRIPSLGISRSHSGGTLNSGNRRNNLQSRSFSSSGMAVPPTPEPRPPQMQPSPTTGQLRPVLPLNSGPSYEQDTSISSPPDAWSPPPEDHDRLTPLEPTPIQPWVADGKQNVCKLLVFSQSANSWLPGEVTSWAQPRSEGYMICEYTARDGTKRKKEIQPDDYDLFKVMNQPSDAGGSRNRRYGSTPRHNNYNSSNYAL